MDETMVQPGQPNAPPASNSRGTGSSEEMEKIFKLCRKDDWDAINECVVADPAVGVLLMTMDNHITTTITHQAITSKGDVTKRAKVMELILTTTPKAAQIKNGYGSLPLHVICQRNTKMKSGVKERLISMLIAAFPGALVEEGGTAKRTPLHIIFTDYINPRLVDLMIQRGSNACFMRDKKGWLPAHVACSRHCSPDKLRMLLQVNPGSLHERTYDGKTLLDLASDRATRSHPNFALIDELNSHLKAFNMRPAPMISPQAQHHAYMHPTPPPQARPSPSPQAHPTPPPQAHPTPPPQAYPTSPPQAHPTPPPQAQYVERYYHTTAHHRNFVYNLLEPQTALPQVSFEGSRSHGASNRCRLVSNDLAHPTYLNRIGTVEQGASIVTPRACRKRNHSRESVATAYSLLLLTREQPSTANVARVSVSADDTECTQGDKGRRRKSVKREGAYVDDQGRPVEIFKI